jgi:hypothetical protein
VVIWFLKTLHSKPVIFPVYSVKETDGENHRGEKANKTQAPPVPAFLMVQSNSHGSINDI